MPHVSEEVFVESCNRTNSTSEVMKELGLGRTSVIQRRNRYYEKTNDFIPLDKNSHNKSLRNTDSLVRHSQVRTKVDLDDGCIIVVSDAHYLPGTVSTAHRAAVYITKELKPDIVVMNGDAFDGAKISRFGRIGWEKAPTVTEEIEAVQDRMEELANASLNSRLLFTWGNHDLRFNTRLSGKVEEFEGVDGFTFEERFPRWLFSMSVMVNENLMIKHRWANGVHAVYNNVLKSGTSIITGHLHSLKVTPWTDYTGTRYGVDTGTLAEPMGEQFSYAEDSPRNHRSGFVVLTIKDSKVLPPELCEVISEEDGTCFFRGRLFAV